MKARLALLRGIDDGGMHRSAVPQADRLHGFPTVGRMKERRG